MNTDRSVTVFGASGHTGRFVVSELRRRGWAPILSARDAEKLGALEAAHRGLDVRPAIIESPVSLDRALAGASAVINCAGPFLDTASALIEAALRAQIHYLDVTAEQAAVRETFERFSERAQERAITVIPAMAFYGGLGDLLATSAIGDWGTADEIVIAIALDSWRPTLGTRRTGERNTFPRVMFTGNDSRRSQTRHQHEHGTSPRHSAHKKWSLLVWPTSLPCLIIFACLRFTRS